VSRSHSRAAANHGVRRLFSRGKSKDRTRRRCRPVCESLEGRQLLSTFTVTSTADSGAGTLRQAILNADAHPGADTIQFQFKVALPGAVQTIHLKSPLPVIGDAVTIDGTIPDPQLLFATKPGVELDGSKAGGDGLVISGGNSTIKGLIIDRFVGNGIVLKFGGKDQISEDYIGTDPTGTIAEGNLHRGVWITSASASNQVVGNVISANGLPYTNAGLDIDGAGCDHNVVTGNRIGTDISGTKALGNRWGLRIENGAQSNRIGTDGDGKGDMAERNIISGNLFDGVAIGGDDTGYNKVAGNYIGTDITGKKPLGNGTDGVGLFNGASFNQVGGGPTGTVQAVLGNVIAFNGGDGVVVTSNDKKTFTYADSVRGNSIFGNEFLGINLGYGGVTLNDPGDTDIGPNGLTNYPQIDWARAGSETNISGVLHAYPSTTYTIDLYASPTPGPLGFGQGRRYLGSITRTTWASGDAFFADHLPSPTAPGEWLSATATDPAGNTSEFSAARELVELNNTLWMPIGPAPVSTTGGNAPVVAGRVDSAVADPYNDEVVYIATDAGGVWKTSDWFDPNPTWLPLTDDQPSLEVGGYHALAMAPSNSSVLYVGASGTGGGVLKTTDAGRTWTRLAAKTFDGASFSALVVSPTDPNTVFAALWDGPMGGGVYRSTDGGQTWTNLTSAAHPGKASDIAIDPANAKILYAGIVGAGKGSGLYRTTDGGMTWVRLDSTILSGTQVGTTIRVVVAPSQPKTLYAVVFDPALGGKDHPDGLPHRYRSTDGGKTWSSLAPIPGDSDWRSWHVVLGVDPTDPDDVYVNGYDGPLYLSTDGGNSLKGPKDWGLIYGEDPVGVFGGPIGSMVLVGDRGIYSIDSGPNPKVHNKQGDLGVTQFYTIALDPTNPRQVYGIAQDHVPALRSSGNDSPVWSQLGGLDEIGKIAVDPNHPNVLYGMDPISTTSYIYRSDDHGQHWAAAGKGLPTAAGDYDTRYYQGRAIQHALLIDPANSNRLIFGVTQVYETTNGAGTWHSVTQGKDLSPAAAGKGPNTIDAVAVAPSNGKTIYASTSDGRLFVTTDDGATAWKERDTSLAGRVLSINVDPQHPGHVFVLTNQGGHATVQVTTDGGLHWNAMAGTLPAGLGGTCLTVDWRFATPQLDLGTTRGVYHSTDLGATWSTFQAGLPAVSVSDLVLDLKNGVLAAATSARGVYEVLVPPPAKKP
jgi:photosystem II stability/assembly factor-like uncharacterized protein